MSLDDRYRRYVESLLRPWFRHPLDQAENKGDILGGTGISYASIPVVPIGLIYESGLVDVRAITGDVLDRLYNINSDPAAWENSSLLYGSFPVGPSIQLRTPGKFTGEMRKVVQALAGTGNIIDYDYSFSSCHGVYTAADSSKWVIEISETHGVRAKELPIIASPPSGDPIYIDLGYFPATPPGGFFDDDETWLELLAPTDTDFVTFYGYDPLWVGCGWAFRSDGHEAQNTAADNITYNQHVIYRYKITISESGNAPSFAVISEVDYGYIIGNQFASLGNSIKHPSNDIIDGGAFASIRNYNSSFDLSSIAGTNSPVYVFYDGMTEVCVRYYIEEETLPQTIIPNPGWSYEPGSPPIPFEETIEYGQKSIFNPSGPYITTGGSTAPVFFNKELSDWTGIGIEEHRWNWYTRTQHVVYSGDSDVWGNPDVYDLGAFVWVEQNFMNEDETLPADTVIIPYHDREAAYKYSYLKYIYDGKDQLTINGVNIGVSLEGVTGTDGTTYTECETALCGGGFYRKNSGYTGGSGAYFNDIGSSSYLLCTAVSCNEPPSYPGDGWCVGPDYVHENDLRAIFCPPEVTGSAGTDYAYQVELVASGGVRETVMSGTSAGEARYPSYNDWTQNLSYNPEQQYMHVIPDSFYDRRIYSIEINGQSAAGYGTINIGPYSAAVTDLATGWDRLFVGNSHD